MWVEKNGLVMIWRAVRYATYRGPVPMARNTDRGHECYQHYVPKALPDPVFDPIATYIASLTGLQPIRSLQLSLPNFT